MISKQAFKLILRRPSLTILQRQHFLFMNRIFLAAPHVHQINRQSFIFSQAAGFAKKSEKDKKSDKKEKEKEDVHAQFEGKDLDTVKQDFDLELSELIENLDVELKQIKSGRAAPNMFDHLEITAYGEKHPFSDLCQVIVKGTNLLLVRVFDDAAKEDVIKALQRAQDFDMNVTVEGKDLKVKLGTSKKEHMDAALKQVKLASDDFKKNVKDVRHSIQDVIKKLDKILPKDEINLLQKDMEKIVTVKEAEAKKVIDAKEKEIKGA